jgi:hypothetical protein
MPAGPFPAGVSVFRGKYELSVEHGVQAARRETIRIGPLCVAHAILTPPLLFRPKTPT